MEPKTDTGNANNVKGSEYATPEDAERYFANYTLMKQLKAEQDELGERLKLAMLSGAEFRNDFHRLKLVEPDEARFDKDKFIQRFGTDHYVLSSALQVGLVKKNLTPAEYERLIQEGEVAWTEKGTPQLRVYNV